MTRTSDQEITFQEVRFEALDALRRGMYTPNGNVRPCVWQDYAPSRHVAPYCNVLSHVETLEDLLLSGSWCDDVVLEPTFDESEDTLRLFRWYGLAFLAFEECIADLRLVRHAARSGPKKVEADAESYMGIINVVWKHRDQAHQGGAFHRMHHHGPYLFADRRGFRTALPPDDVYLALGHPTPSHAHPPVPLVVPSLVTGMRALARVLTSTSSVLRDRAARARVEKEYGAVRF